MERIMKTFDQFVSESEKSFHDHVKDALRLPFETHKGNLVKGATLNDIHDHVKSKGWKISARALDDHLYDHRREISHEEGHSRSGWTRKGLTKRSRARFYTMHEPYEWSDSAKKHVPGHPEYIENKPS